jgi:tRNA pseudouridine55 synthase
LNGFVILDKPTGATSFSMVSLLRRLTGVRRVGHAGTLDPLASGVLPIAIGTATRFIEYTDVERKAYRATVRFGVETDTYDSEGRVTATVDASHLAPSDVESALRAFVGEIEQTPPAFSALKVRGRPLYSYARSGEAVAAKQRRVVVDRIELLRYEDSVGEFEVRCGRGTYIRSIAHDLGRALGTGAHLTALRRTSSGGFTLGEAHAPAEIEEAGAQGRLEELVLAPDRAVERLDAAILAERRAEDVVHGREVHFRADAASDLLRAYSLGGDFLGVLRATGGGAFHPAKVVSGAERG